MQALTRQPVAASREFARAGRLLPAAAALVTLCTFAYGFAARASGERLGSSLAPLLAQWRPVVELSALPALVALAAALAAAPRLRSSRVSPGWFAVAALAVGLVLRLALGFARRGPEELWSVFQIGKPEAASEYLPALAAFRSGARVFLDTFAEVGPSLPVHAVGHPPGLLLVLHWLRIDSAEGMAALVIAAGAGSIPLAYVLGRTLLDERRARVATLLYVFAPSGIIYGATSADALYVTLGLLAAIPLAAAATAARTRAALLAAGAAMLAVASFFSYANLGLAAWATFVAAKSGRRRPLAIAAACGTALLAFYASLHLATGYDPIGAFQAAHAVYREGIANLRPYAFWLFGSPVAFLVAAGIPISWYALRAAGQGDVPALALIAVIATAAVLGFTKAETERIYLFLLPLACVAAAAVLPERQLVPVLAALAAQALATELLLYTVW